MELGQEHVNTAVKLASELEAPLKHFRDSQKNERKKMEENVKKAHKLKVLSTFQEIVEPHMFLTSTGTATRPK